MSTPPAESALLADLTEQAAQETDERKLYDAFSEVGSDAEASDVEFALSAQAEVALRD